MLRGTTNGETSADQAAATLMDEIIDGSIAPGTPLRLQELSRRLNMSMMPVREALRRLEAIGLVEIEPHKGAWVRPMTLADLLDTYWTRLNLETVAIREAAATFTAERGAAALEALEAQNAARERGDLVAARVAHERFHFTLYEGSGSSWLVRSIIPAWRNSERYRVEMMRHPEFDAKRRREHRGILKSLQEHDGEAAMTKLVSHLQTTLHVVAADLAADGGIAGQPSPNLVGRLPPLKR